MRDFTSILYLLEVIVIFLVDLYLSLIDVNTCTSTFIEVVLLPYYEYEEHNVYDSNIQKYATFKSTHLTAYPSLVYELIA